MTQKIETFLAVLRESQLLEAQQIDELAATPEAKASDLNGAAKVILQKGWLTRFQLTLIGQGKTKELMLGPYRLLDRLGEGGMGMVYKAFHQPMSRTVALKVIRKEKLANTQAVQRFFREVQAAAKLVHPNIVVAFDANQVNGTHYFAMEYVDGIDLAKLVKQNGPLPVPVACDYIRQAALGLQHAHEQGMVHRDIKPHNLLVSQAGHDLSTSKASSNSSSKLGPKAVVKILDMGLARLSTTPADNGLTQDGAVIGTPEYIPPEQARDSRTADIRADLYSLGCTFFYLLTGRPPFQAGTLAEILLKHQMDAPPDVRQLRAEVPADVAAIVTHLLAKRPEERFQTPQEVAQALEPICQGGSNPYVLPRRAAETSSAFSDLHGDDEGSQDSLSAVTQADGQASARRSTMRARKPVPAAGMNKGLIAGLGVAAVLLIGLIVWLVLPKGDPTPQNAGVTPTERATPPGTGAGTPAVAELSLVLPLTLSVNAGEKQPLKIQVKRQTPNQIINVKINGLPVGVFAQPSLAIIDGDKDSVDVMVTAGLDVRDLQQEVEVEVDNGKFNVKEKFRLAVKGRTTGTPPMPPLPTAKDNREIRQFPWLSGAPALGVAFCMNDSQFVTVGPDPIMRSWNVEKGFDGSAMQGPAPGQRGPAITADGRRAFVGYMDGSARLWDLSMGKALQTVKAPSPIEAVDVTADGRLGVTAGGKAMTQAGQPPVFSDCVAIVWDLETGKEVARYAKHGNPVRKLAISPDGKKALTVDYGPNGTFALWELSTGQEIQSKPSIGFFATRMVFAPDGKHFFTANADRIARMWDATNLQIVREYRGHESGMLGLAVSADGKRLVTSGGGVRTEDGKPVPIDCSIRVWDIASGKELQQCVGHTRPVECVSLARDGKTLLSTAGDQTIRLWDLEKAGGTAPPTGNLAKGEVRRLSTSFIPSNLFYLAASRHVLTANSDSRLRTWDIEDTKELRVLSGPMGIRTSAVSADGRRAFTVFGDGSAVLWNTDTGEEVQRLQIPTPVSTACLSPDARYAMTAGGRIVDENGQKVAKDYEALVWDLETGKEVARYQGHRSMVGRSAISADGRRILMSTGGGGLHLWELTTGKQLKFQPNATGISKIYFAPDGRHVFLAIGPQVQMWNAETLEFVRTVAAHEVGISNMAIAADNRYLLTCSGSQDGTDCTVRLWEIETGKELKKFEGHTRTVTAVVFSADGRFAVSSGADQTIRQWDLGQAPLVAVKPPPTPVQKAKPPEDAKVAAKQKEMRELFKEDYAKTRNPERRAFAAKLLETAGDAKIDAIERFTLLREAADLAAAGAGPEVAMKAIDQMADTFDVDGGDLKLKALTLAFKTAQLVPEQKAVADAALVAADDAADDDKYDLALQLVALAEAAARKGNVAMIQRCLDRKKELADTQKDAEGAKAAADTLKEKPEDLPANLVLGKFLAFRKGDWEAGLAHLAKGDDPALNALAKKDLANPNQATGQVDVGNGWWDLAAAAQGSMKLRYNQRASYWYQQARPNLTGVSLASVDGRLKQIAALEPLPLVEIVAVRLTGHTDKIFALTVSPDGRFALSGGADRTVRVWDIAAGNLWHSYTGFQADVRGLGWSNDGRYAAMCMSDGGLRLMEPELKRNRSTWNFPNNPLTCIAVYDDARAFTGNARGRITPWGIGTNPPGPGYGNTKLIGINSVAVTSDGRFGLCGNDDGTARYWALETGFEQGVLFGHSGPVLGVALSKDSKQAVTASADKTLRLWDLGAGKTLRTFKGHGGKVTCVAMTPDGRYLLSGSEDKTVRLWDLKSGKELRRLTGHDDQVTGVGITPDGRYILSASLDKVVRLWDLKPTKP